MEDEHRVAIQKCFISLVEQTDLDTMVSALYEKGVFSEAMIEPYKDQSKDQRQRKRLLYTDVTRRGPHAFGHLVDALREAGNWQLAHELDPKSLPFSRPPATSRPVPRPKSNDSEFLSLSEAKKLGTAANILNVETTPAPILEPPLPPPAINLGDFPKVIKSTKFMDDNGKDIKLYRTRGRRRGVLVVFSYIAFASELETYRRGVDVDCQMLKHLFSEFGFEVISFQNLAKEETLMHMKSLPLAGAECVFIVVSSHGYARAGSWDTDIRCSDGGLISSHAVVDRFNNQNWPALRGVPKVFIFQTCRGDKLYQELLPAETDGAPYGEGEGEGEGAGEGGGARRGGAGPAPRRADRVYSDILIAHSTLPGFVSHRDLDSGSWFIQALCEVFAAHAHARHVLTLFQLVDKALQRRFRVQTSVVENWGFNSKLYLHPGLFEDD